MKSPAKALSGFTLVELMVAVAILLALVSAVVPLIRVGLGGLTAMEAKNKLNVDAQRIVNHLRSNLTQSKRLFARDAGAFLSRVVLAAPAPAALGGSRLPEILERGAVSPADPASVGNRLFFAAFDRSFDINGARVDTYRFKYFYLAAREGRRFGRSRPLGLWEWESGPYADYDALIALAPAVRQPVIDALVNQHDVRFAWAAGADDPATAFYTLAAGQLNPALQAAHRIRARTDRSPRNLLPAEASSAPSGYSLSVSPNSNAAMPTLHPVPQFATAAGNFPSGLEILIVGPSIARQVYIRAVFVAQGGFRGFASVQQVVLATVRDSW